MKKMLLAVAFVLACAQAGFAGEVFHFQINSGGSTWGSPSAGETGNLSGQLIFLNGTQQVDVGKAFLTYFRLVRGSETITLCVIDIAVGDLKLRTQTYSSSLMGFTGDYPTTHVLFGDLISCDPGIPTLPGGSATPATFSFQVR